MLILNKALQRAELNREKCLLLNINMTDLKLLDIFRLDRTMLSKYVAGWRFSKLAA